VDLSPGDHRVEVFWEGQGSWTGGAKVVAGQRTDVVAQVPEGRVGQGEGGAVNGSGSGGTGGQGNGARNGKPWWPWLLVGVGGAAAAGGGAAFYVAYERNKNLDGATQTEIDEKFNSEVVPPAYTAYALWGVGGALVAGGVAALLLTGDSGGSERGTVSFFPDLSPDHVGATVGISF
jgi:hypothetical protein